MSSLPMEFEKGCCHSQVCRTKGRLATKRVGVAVDGAHPYIVYATSDERVCTLVCMRGKGRVMGPWKC